MKGETVRRGRHLWIVLLLALRPAATSAWAQADASGDARERAQQLLEQGNGLFRNGDVTQALRRYRDAYQAFPSAKLFFNIGACEEKLGERASAMRDFVRYLGDPAATDAEARAVAEERTRALAAALVAVDVAGPDHVVVQLDGAVAGLTPFKTPLWVEPGAHRIVVERAGQPAFVATVSGDAGGRARVVITDAAPAVEPGPTLPPRPEQGAGEHPARSRGPWLWIGLGALVVGGIVTTYLLLNRCPADHCM